MSNTVIVELHGTMDERAETLERIHAVLGPEDTWFVGDWRLSQRIQQRGRIPFRWFSGMTLSKRLKQKAS